MMMLIRPISIGLICLVLAGCGIKKVPVTNPELPSIVGQYEFLMVGVGVGHGYIVLPGIWPFGQSQELMYIEPIGNFVFNPDSTFKILFKMFGLPIDGSGQSISSFPVELFGGEVIGTYKITSNHTITFKTQYGVSEYLFSLSDEHQFYLVQLMPINFNHFLKVGDYRSTQGESMFDVIRLSRYNSQKP